MPAKSKKVLFMPSNTAGVNYWRFKIFWKYMRRKGIDAALYDYNPHRETVGDWEMEWFENQNKRAEIYSMLRYCDIAVIGYIHYAHALALVPTFREKKDYDTIIHTKGPKKMVCEIDDMVLDTPEYNPAFKGGWTPGNEGEEVVIGHLRQSDAVINSTDHLAKYHKQYNKKSYVIPNAIDFEDWQVKLRRHSEHGRIRIGWIGGGNHDEDLRIMETVVPEMLKKYKNIEFYFVHGVPSYLKNVGKRCKYTLDWRDITRYPNFIARQGFDIGIAPLEYNEFNCAKSNLRWLEYSALRVPTVATDIETYKCIERGKTGFLCKTADEWIEKLSYLVENEELRKKMGDTAYKELEKNWNADKVTDDYIKLLRRI